jgi:hypothetical protein
MERLPGHFAAYAHRCLDPCFRRDERSWMGLPPSIWTSAFAGVSGNWMDVAPSLWTPAFAGVTVEDWAGASSFVIPAPGSGLGRPEGKLQPESRKSRVIRDAHPLPAHSRESGNPADGSAKLP